LAEEAKAKNNGVPYQDVAISLLGDYPGIGRWLENKALTTDVKEIKEILGISTKQITKCLETGAFKRAPRNQERIIISSVVSWLRNTPSPQRRKSAQPRGDTSTEKNTEYLAVVTATSE
jgi:hypothetical protein